MNKNKIISFVLGLSLTFVSSYVFAVGLPDTAVSGGYTTRIHSMLIGGGFDDVDGNGITVGNQGDINIKRTEGSVAIANVNTANVETNAGGLLAQALHLPIIGITRFIPTSSTSGYNSGSYGRVGLEGEILGNEYGTSSSTKGYVGITSPDSSTNLYTPLSVSNTATTSSLTQSTPYAFYTTNNTYFGDDLVIDGELSNPGTNPVTITSPVTVEGNMNINGTLNGKFLTVTNATNFRNHWQPSGGLAFGGNSQNETLGAKFSATSQCPQDTYVIGCSGYVTGAEAYAPYRGEKMTSSSALNGVCTAYARDDIAPTGPTFMLYAISYCFDPQL